MRGSSRTRRRAQDLRKEMSPPEAPLRVRLRARQEGAPSFRRQHPIGPYIADFYCAAARLVIEVDGALHGEDDRRLHDERRDVYMRGLGYRIIRVSGAEVMADPDEIAQGLYV